ncbi:MAG: hypothetical protein OEO23_09635 [Gemmatimonadota bacterium]|nr:hypothetical protein [Gemmatimonadota bacterium]
MSKVRVLFLCIVLAGYGCAGPDTNPVDVDGATVDALADAADGLGRVNGGGYYALVAGGTTLDIQVAFSGEQTALDESATGTFHHRTTFGETRLEYHGRMTCLAIDPEEGRAWIGGIITLNKSDGAAGTNPLRQPGKDIWFRILDVGDPGTAGDRTTFVGFEGSGGIITSQEYCDTRPWPDNNDRTWPMIAGNLKIQP